MDIEIFFSKLEEAFNTGESDEERIRILKESFKTEEMFNLATAYETVKAVLREWIDMEERYYKMLGLWIIGTYFMDCFESYAYIFINATKRSGKSRLLKLLGHICNGIHTTSLTEAVLFRLPSQKNVGLFIDEAERLGSKEKSALRELLNTAYKRGIKIYRSRKMTKTERFTIDEFEIFVPVGIANISGLDDVLEDRCLTIVLERSYNPEIVNKPEIFNLDEKIWFFKVCMARLSGESDEMTEVMIKRTYNSIARSFIKPTNITPLESFVIPSFTSFTSLSSLDNSFEEENTIKEVIDMIKTSGILGRDMELYLPLFSLASTISFTTFKENLEIGKGMVREKYVQDITEDRNIEVLVFLAKYLSDKEDGFHLQKHLARLFREETESEWINSKVFGGYLKTLKIVIEKRKVSKGVEVRLNRDKILQSVKRMGIDIEGEIAREKETQKTLEELDVG